MEIKPLCPKMCQNIRSEMTKGSIFGEFAGDCGLQTLLYNAAMLNNQSPKGRKEPK
ncbi:MAG: hypothetical protein LBQ76_08560 [Candidatus Fibromonas sp.]|nr:hypothetical protein [Candidatus Fibromonas sp.]